MRGEWCYFKGAEKFSDEECNELIRHTFMHEPSAATIGIDGKLVQTDFRKSDIWFLHPELHPELFRALWALALRANADWFGFHIDRLEYVQIARYEAGGEYKPHQDVFWITPDDKHRKLSCVIQLSPPDTYSGGDLTFTGVNEHPNAEDLRARGTVAFFPSFVYHAAQPVTDGVRYSLAAWFEGPKWR